MTQTLTARVSSEDKAVFERFCDSVGLTVSAAINIFVKATIAEGEIPFAVKQRDYKPEVLAAMDEADKIAQGKEPSNKAYRSAEELFKDLDKQSE